MQCRLWLALLAIACALPPGGARAEHRVALLLSAQPAAPEGPLARVHASFQAQGFRCELVHHVPNEKALRNNIESFATRTPSCSTAALYFHGRKGEDASLLAADGRGKLTLEAVTQAFKTRGASRQTLLFLDIPQGAALQKPTGPTWLEQGDTAALLAKLARHEALAFKASRAIRPPSEFTPGIQAGDEWVNSMGLVFCWCPPGKYVAGSPETLPNRYPDESQRPITIEHGFWLSKYELASGQPVANRRGSSKSIARHKLEPMTMINHDDAKRMAVRFTESERKAGRLPNDWEYALPTEAQWEYAARAGTTTRHYFGDDLAELPRHANFADKTYYDSGDIFSTAAHRTLDDGALRLAPIGSYQANPWGFHDMYGNVAEWCSNLAVRGGSWASVAENCRSAYRDFFSSRNEQNFIGYRLVIQKTAKPKQQK